MRLAGVIFLKYDSRLFSSSAWFQTAFIKAFRQRSINHTYKMSKEGMGCLYIPYTEAFDRFMFDSDSFFPVSDFCVLILYLIAQFQLIYNLVAHQIRTGFLQ